MKRLSVLTMVLLSSSVTLLAQTITGTGTLNYIPKFTGTSAIGNSAIYQNGTNVGIGTIAPLSKLQIGAQTSTATSSPDAISLGGTFSTVAGANMKIKLYDDGTSIFGLGISANQLDYEVPSTTNDHVFYQGTNELMRLKGTGNVGIGVSAPSSKLTVKGPLTGAVLDNVGRFISDANYVAVTVDATKTDGTSQASVLFAKNGVQTWNMGTDFGASGTKDFFLYDATNSRNPLYVTAGGDVRLGGTSGYAGTQAMTILKAGNVGVGTTTPNANAMLDVNGNIFTNSKILINYTNVANVTQYALAVNGSAIFTKAIVKLNANWPDYIFADNYKLLPLAEVEKFVNKNKHLPEVPSASEVSKDGIDLGGNQTVLLKKVEELTLYMIDLNKKLEEQDKEIKDLKKQIKVL